MLYVRSIFTEPIVPTEGLAVAKELVDKGITKAVVSSSFEKSASLVKKSKSGSGCNKDSAQELCEKLLKIPDIQSNAFGESRMMVLKANKKQMLDTCTTNANIGILVSSKDDVRLTVAGATTELKAGEPVGLDFCLEASFLELFWKRWKSDFTLSDGDGDIDHIWIIYGDLLQDPLLPQYPAKIERKSIEKDLPPIGPIPCKFTSPKLHPCVSPFRMEWWRDTHELRTKVPGGWILKGHSKWRSPTNLNWDKVENHEWNKHMNKRYISMKSKP